METKSTAFKIRLGLFVAGGLILFVAAIFIIGSQKNMFDPVIRLTTTFHNVGGLQVGSNVRFAGINVGTVDRIMISADSSVVVDFLVEKDVQQFIRTDCSASIGSEGIIGDRILVISQGSSTSPQVQEGQQLSAIEPVGTDEIMASVQVTALNAEIISDQLAEILIKVNNGDGTLGRLIQDTTIADNIDQTIENLKSSSKGLDQNMEAAKDNFLLRGYFRKKEREAEERREQKKKDDEEKKEEKKD